MLVRNVPNGGLAAEERTGVQGLVSGIRVTKSPLSNIRRYRSRPFVKVTRAKGKKSSFASGTSLANISFAVIHERAKRPRTARRSKLVNNCAVVPGLTGKW